MEQEWAAYSLNYQLSTILKSNNRYYEGFLFCLANPKIYSKTHVTASLQAWLLSCYIPNTLTNTWLQKGSWPTKCKEGPGKLFPKNKTEKKEEAVGEIKD